MTEPVLKPCPFCGSKPVVWQDHAIAGNEIFEIRCPKASWCGAKTTTRLSLKSAIEAWNRRWER